LENAFKIAKLMLNHHVLNIKTPGKILKHVIYVSGGKIKVNDFKNVLLNIEIS
jgi:sporulation-control protein spo0M